MLIKKVIYFVLFFSSLAQADLYTPSTINLEASQLSDLLNKTFKEGIQLQKELKTLPLVEGLKLNVEKINYKAEIYPKFKFESDGTTEVEAQINQAYFEIHNFDLNHRLVKYVGSTRINVNTYLSCDYLKVSLKNKISYKVKGSLRSGKPVIYESLIPENLQFVIESKNCDGPENFENFLPELAIEWLKSAEGLRETLAFVDEEVVQEYWNQIKKGLEFDLFGRKIFVALKELNFSNGKMKIYIVIRWADKEFYHNEDDVESDESFAMEVKDFYKILNYWMKQECFVISYQRSDIPGVDKLFNNKFIKFLAWRDLNNFPNDVDFNIKVKFCLNDLKIKRVLKEGLEFSHNSDVFIEMNMLDKNKKELPYVFMWSKAKGLIKLISNDMGLAIGFSKTELDFKVKFHGQMNSWRTKKASGLPSMSLLMPYILPSLEDDVFSILPEFSTILNNKEFTSGNGILEYK